MMENLSFVLFGLAGIVALLAFIGAHNSPVPMPNISKAGCITAVALLVIGFSLGMYTPVKKFNDCANTCDDVLSVDVVLAKDHDKARAAVLGMTELDIDDGEYETYISPGRLDYLACKKGAREASQKRKVEAAKTKKKLEEENNIAAFNPEDFADEDPEIIEARCEATSRDRCTVACFKQ
ncbi:MAG: hypothetical protein ACPGTU_16705 [Myxococcota bacterium]